MNEEGSEAKFPEMELSERTDLIATQAECPVCGEKYLRGVPYVKVTCKRCNISYKSVLEQNIYDKVARRIESMLAINDGIILRSTEKFERDLLHIMYNYKKYGNWDVTDDGIKNEEFRYCLNCGVCLSCLTCKNCGKTFKDERKQGKRQICPHCKSNNYTRTYYKEPIVGTEGAKARLCPHCKSDNIKPTFVITSNKCPKCGSTNLTVPKVNKWHFITIKRKRKYMLKNLPSED